MTRLLAALCSLLLYSWCFAAPAQRIVSLAPNLTELAFAAGAGERIVGTVDYSDFPEAARKIPRVGDAFRVDFERVLALRPDAVLTWEPGTPQGVTQRLKELRLNVVTIETHTLADIARGLRELGALVGSKQVSEPAARVFEAKIATLRERYKARPIVTVFLQVNDRPLFTVNDRQIMSEVIALCGGRNVFGSLNELAPQVSVEAVIAADPQLIVVTGEARAQAAAEWKRWSQMNAVRADTVFQILADDLARSTPRLAQGAEQFCRMLETGRERLGRLQSRP
jgi:iron complex transport system substrate-binding protein